MARRKSCQFRAFLQVLGKPGNHSPPTPHEVFEPLDFMARLASLVPKPRVHLTRYHGVFAPHSRWRAEVTPAGRGKPAAPDLRTPAERHRAIP